MIRIKKQLQLEFLEYGIANVSIIPVRAEASEKSEMVTQVLFGEHFEIITASDKWAFIKLHLDGYKGWIDRKMILPISKRTYQKISEHGDFVVPEVTKEIYLHFNEPSMTIVGGSSLPLYNGKRSFRIEKFRYKMKGKHVFENLLDIRKNIVKKALSYVNAPYLWGGRSPFGIDCSGFTQVIYKICGIKIPRDAGEQVLNGGAINFVNEAKPGDLAFFDNEEGVIIHVGILLGENKIIHSSGKVRVDMIDHNGIFNVDTKRYSHKLRVIKDIIGN